MKLSEIARYTGGILYGDPEKEITEAVPVEMACEKSITFAENSKVIKRLEGSNAGAVIVPPDVRIEGINVICSENPKAAFARVIGLLHPPSHPAFGISEHAVIGDRFSRGKEVFIGPCAVLGADVSLGERVLIHAGTVIGDRVRIGDDVVIHPNVTLCSDCVIGSRVIIHSGTVIGSDGFGFVPDRDLYLKIPHRGFVRIDDDVEIGANNTIDRATYGKTWIKKGVKTDNLVHIAHNVTIGENTVIVAQVGISGSVTIGRNCIIAGQAGIAGHLKIGDHAVIGPQAGVAKDVDDRSMVSGTLEMPHSRWLRVQRILPMLPDLKRRLERLEKLFQKKA